VIRELQIVCREQNLARKRQEYADQVREHFEISPGERGEDDAGALRQVSVDVPRTAPGVAFFHQEPVQRSLERILYIWGIRWVDPAGIGQELTPESLPSCPSKRLAKSLTSGGGGG